MSNCAKYNFLLTVHTVYDRCFETIVYILHRVCDINNNLRIDFNHFFIHNVETLPRAFRRVCSAIDIKQCSPFFRNLIVTKKKEEKIKTVTIYKFSNF